MPVPDFQSQMRPLLGALSDGERHSIASIRDDVAEHFSLGQDDVEERIPSGRVTTLQNRVGWAATYLAENPERVDLKCPDSVQRVQGV